MFDEAEDRDRMARIARGDQEAFEALYRSYERALGQFLFRMCYDKSTAEDALQEVFMRVWRAAPRWRGESKVSTFLFQVAKNAGLDAREKTLRERARLGGSGGAGEDDESRAAAPERADESAGPVRTLVGKELRAVVRRAVEALPEDQRAVVELAQTEGFTYREIAEILQVPVGTVKSRMAAAAESLRWKLERHVRE
ncbi:MAG: sigma-70 family RNA polymerase sigma factor [Planctomycetota bacterium]|nr:sigma-70 family RNA polymerase sigma factor [Planctomycetota bacterium]